MTARDAAAPRGRTAFLVGLDTTAADRAGVAAWGIEQSLDELARLAETAGLTVAGQTWQRRAGPDPRTYLGAGRLADAAHQAHAAGAGVLVFDDELTPAQLRNVEAAGGELLVLDRTALILDVFARHARSREGQLQVELAQLEYRLPRLTRMWTHLARQAGGRAGAGAGVGLRGPGEAQIEADRRQIRRRLGVLRARIDRLREQRRHGRARRSGPGSEVLALVGYTNAGKSTLMNHLTGAGVRAADHLFATLDPTTRRWELGAGRRVLLTDTVGFIQKLPPQLVAAFRATLEEVAAACLLLVVVDAGDPRRLLQQQDRGRGAGADRRRGRAARHGAQQDRLGGGRLAVAAVSQWGTPGQRGYRRGHRYVTRRDPPAPRGGPRPGRAGGAVCRRGAARRGARRRAHRTAGAGRTRLSHPRHGAAPVGCHAAAGGRPGNRMTEERILLDQRIVLIEDDPAVAKGLKFALQQEGYAVSWAPTGAAGHKLVAGSSPHLIVLDIRLPDTSGFDLCRRLRSEGYRQPILMLTARDEEVDKVLGFELGADDYVVKPYHLRELLSRIRALLRRAYGELSRRSSNEKVTFDDVTIDLELLQVFRGGRNVYLTPTEFRLLRYLISNPDRPVTRDQILEAVWGYQADVGYDRTVDVHMRHLREKLEADPTHPRRLVTVRGHGYKFADRGVT